MNYQDLHISFNLAQMGEERQKIVEHLILSPAITFNINTCVLFRQGVGLIIPTLASFRFSLYSVNIIESGSDRHMLYMIL